MTCETGGGVSKDTRGVSNFEKDSSADHPSREIYCDLLDTVRRHSERGLQLKVRHNEKNEIIHITGIGATQVAMASDGLEDMLELAQVTAEHHPYWGLLYHLSDVADSILREWNGALSADQIDNIMWSLREMNSMIEKIRSVDDAV